MVADGYRWQTNAASLMGWHTAMPLHRGSRRLPLRGCSENCVIKECTSKQKENSMRDHRAVASQSSHCVHTSITHAHIRVMSTALEEQQHFLPSSRRAEAVAGSQKKLQASNRTLARHVRQQHCNHAKHSARNQLRHLLLQCGRFVPPGTLLSWEAHQLPP